MRVKKKNLDIMSFLYIYVPIVVFLFGWTKIAIASVCTLSIIILASRILNYKKTTLLCENVFLIDWAALCAAAIVFVVGGYYMGWGRWVTQASDWNKHNGIISDLITRRWPVYYVNGDESSMLTYYIAQYLVPALFGKFFSSFRVAEISMFLWNELGLFLVWVNLIRLLKTESYLKQTICALFLVFWGTPLWLAQVLMHLFLKINNTGSLYWLYNDGNIMLQYSKNYTALRWVYPQVSAIWLILLYFLMNKEKIQHYVF